MIEIDISFHFEQVEENLTPLTLKLYDKADTDNIALELKRTEQHISELIVNAGDIDVVWDTFTRAMHTVIGKYVPTITVKPRKRGGPYWFNNMARKIVSKQRRKYNKYRASGQKLHLDQYKIFRRESKKTLRKLHSEYLENCLFGPMVKGDSKCFYRFLKAKTGKSNSIKSLDSNRQPGLTLEHPEEIANELNKYFKSVFNLNLTDTPVFDFF